MVFIYRLLVCVVMVLASAAPLQADDMTDLLAQGQANLANGYYQEAENQFSQVEAKAIGQNNAYVLVSVQALQGYLALQRQHHVQAEQLLTAALGQAKQHGWQDLVTRISLYLGQLYQRNQDSGRANGYFQQAVADPEKIADKSLLVSGFYQLAKVAIENHHAQQAWQQLQHATALLGTLPASQDNSQLWLNIGYQTQQLYQLSPQDNYLAAAFNALNKALALAGHDRQARTQAAALKHLAGLYKQQQRNDEAVNLLLEAVGIAQHEEAGDMLIDLEWQIGQLYQQQNHLELAVAAFRRAVRHIDSVRIDIPVSYQKGRSSFRDTFAPIYLALADLLLRQSATAKPAQQQALLAEARDSIERMKKTELEDYFQSRCDISATPINLQKIDTHAAALYPISLPDRLELIVYTAEGLHRFTSPVTAKELEQQARLFSGRLRSYQEFSFAKETSQLLYRWLVAPIDALLKQQQIETLVYIPDGALRLVPLAALYDGNKFVIQDYAVATSPGMTLIDSSGFQHQKRMLLAGMSLPGEVVGNLPDPLLPLTRYAAVEPEKTAANQALPIIGQQEKNRELRERLKKSAVIEKLQKLLALPGVDTEIRQLAAQNHIAYLLNDSFSLANFTRELTEKPHDILHIASHGFFGSSAEDSFIMTYDKILNLNQFEALLNSDYFKQYPIDLLTLSACQTAEGDDRSPLGISGMAIKAKVHSALGSLWPVADEATAELMTAFYLSLNKPGQTKAKALQEAMLGLLKQKKYSDPSFWSPFVLIGNWL